MLVPLDNSDSDFESGTGNSNNDTMKEKKAKKREGRALVDHPSKKPKGHGRTVACTTAAEDKNIGRAIALKQGVVNGEFWLVVPFPVVSCHALSCRVVSHPVS